MMNQTLRARRVTLAGLLLVPLMAGWSPTAEARGIYDPAIVLERAEGMLSEAFAFCQTLPLDEFGALDEALRGRGLRPERVRPFAAGGGLRVAALWVRDPAEVRVELGASGDDLKVRDARLRGEGFAPIDVSGYLARQGDSPQIRHAAVWQKSPERAAGPSLYLEVPASRHPETANPLRDGGLAPAVLQQYRDASGQILCDGLWVRRDGRWRYRWGRRPAFEETRDELAADYEQLDVSASPLPSQSRDSFYGARIESWGRYLEQAPKDAAAHYGLGVSTFWRGGDDGSAEEHLTAAAELVPGLYRGFVYGYRAIVRARAGKADLSRADLARFREEDASSADQAYFEALAEGYAGRLDAAVARLDAELARRPLDPLTPLRTAQAFAALAGVGRGEADRLARRSVEMMRAVTAVSSNLFEDPEGFEEFLLIRDHPAHVAFRHETRLDHETGAVWMEQGSAETTGLHSLDPRGHLARCRELASKGWRLVSLVVVEASEGQPPVAGSAWRRPLPQPVLAARDLQRQARSRAAAHDEKGALELIRQVVALRKEHLGELHPHYRDCLRDRYILTYRVGRLDEAEATLRDLLRLLDAAPRPDKAAREETVAALDRLVRERARDAVREGDWATVRDRWQGLRDLRSGWHGDGDRRTRGAAEEARDAESRLALPEPVRAALAESDRLIEEAEQVSRDDPEAALARAVRAASLRETHLGPSSRPALVARLLQARLLIGRGRRAEAEPLLEAIVAARGKPGVPEDDLLIAALVHLASVQLGKDQVPLAVATLTRAESLVVEVFGATAPESRGILRQLVSASRRHADDLEAADSLDAAAVEWDRLDQLVYDRRGRDDPELRDIRWWQDHVAVLKALDREGRSELRRAGSSLREARRLLDAGQAAKAVAPAEQALADYARRLDEDDPARVEATLLLARARLSLKDHQAAAARYREAERVVARVLGPDHDRAREVIDALTGELTAAADGEIAAGRWVEAAALYAEALAARERRHPRDEAQVAEARVTADDTRRTAGLAPDGLKRVEEAQGWIVESRRLDGQGDYDRAMGLAARALVTLREVLGEDHGDAQECLGWMARFYFEKGDPARAQQLAAPYAAHAERRLGPDHPRLAERLAFLGRIYLALGETERSLVPLRRAVAIDRKVGKVGEESRDRSNSLAGALEDAAGRAEADDDLKSALALRQELLGVLIERHGAVDWRVVDARLMLDLLGRLAAAPPARSQEVRSALALLYQIEPLVGAGKHAEALEAATRAEAALREALGPDDRRVGDCWLRIADLRRVLGPADAACSAYDRATAVYAATLGKRHPDYAKLLRFRSAFHEGAGETERAEALLRESAAISRAAGGKSDAQYVEAIDALAGLHERAGRRAADAGHFDRASEHYAEAASLVAGLRGEADYRAVNLRLRLDYVRLLSRSSADDREQLKQAETLSDDAWALYQSGKRGEAMARYEASRDKYAGVLGKDHPYYASVVFTLGWMREEAGEYVQAEALHREALAVRQRALGVKHIDYARSLNQLGWVLQTLNDAKKAEPLHRQALEVVRGAVGEGHEEYARTLNFLALAVQELGDLDQAEPLFQQALHIHERAGGKESTDYLTALNNLALLQKARGRIDEAERTFRLALEGLGRRKSADPINYALTTANLAQLLQDQGRHADAEPLLVEALAIRRGALGDNHTLTIQTLKQLAQVYRALNRPEALGALTAEARSALDGPGSADFGMGRQELSWFLAEVDDFEHAVEALRRTFEERERVLGAAHQLTTQARNNLVRMIDRRRKWHFERGEFEAARRDEAEVLERMTAVVGADHWRAINVRLDLARLDAILALPADRRERVARAEERARRGSRLLGEDKPAEAAGPIAEALAIEEELLGAKSARVPPWLEMLGRAYSEAGETARAGPILRRAVEAQEALTGRQNLSYASRLKTLSRNYWRSKEYPKAEAPLLQALAILEGLKLDRTTDYADTLNELGGVYHWSDDDARAEPLFLKSVELYRVLKGENATDYADALSNLGSVYRQLTDFDRALEAFQKALAVQARVHGPDHPETIGALNSVANTLSGADRIDECEDVLREVIARRTRVYGQGHPRVAESKRYLSELLGRTATRAADRQDYAAESKVCAEIEALRTELFGPGDRRTADARQARLRADRRAAASPEEQKEELHARRLALESRRLEKAGRLDEAIAVQRQLLAIRARLPGRDHVDYALELDWLGRFYRLKSDYDRAEQAVGEALDVYHRVLGEAHPSAVDALAHLARIAAERGDDGRAAGLRRKALSLTESGQGRGSEAYAQAHANLVTVLQRRAARLEKEGRLDQARPLLGEVAGLLAGRLGGDDWRVFDARQEEARLGTVAGLDADHKARLAEAGRLGAEVARLIKEVKADEGVAPAARRAEAIAAALGKENPTYLDALETLCWFHLGSKEPGNADRPIREGQEIATRILPARHPRRGAFLRLEAVLHEKLGEAGRAEDCYRRSLAVYNEVFGRGREAAETVRDALVSLLEGLARAHARAGEFDEAVRVERRLVDLAVDEYGAFDWRVTDARLEAAHVERLAKLTPDQRRQLDEADAALERPDPRSSDEFHEAIVRVRKAVEVRESLLGETDPDVEDAYRSLVLLLHASGDIPRARELGRRRLDLAVRTFGHHHPTTAMALNDYAACLRGQGDDGRALAALMQALDIRRKTMGTEDRGYANILYNLALQRLAAGQLDLARRNLFEATNLLGRLSGRDSLEYAAALGSLAMIGDDIAAVEAQLREALEITRTNTGGDSPRIADLVGPLILLLRNQGRPDEAVPLMDDVLRIRTNALGPEHPDVAEAHLELAEVHLGRGRFGEAESHLRQAFASFGPALEVVSSRTDHEQGELARLIRQALDVWMLLVTRAGFDPERAYEPVLAWKGVVFQQERRVHRSRLRPELLPRLDELEVLNSRIAASQLSPPEEIDRPRWQAEIKALRDQKRELEATLAAASAAFSRNRAEGGLTSGGLRALLPRDVALVDVVPAVDPDAPAGEDTRLLAFVVRRDRPVALFDLGPEPELTGLIDAWRKTLGQGPEADKAAAALKRLTWEKWAPSLDGAATVLVSPDRVLARFPLSALPGKAAGTFLLEDFRLAVLPSARLLPDLLDAPGQDAADKAGESLLLVGDISYGADPGAPLLASHAPIARRAAREGEGQSFEPLEGTKQEIDMIARLFRDQGQGAALVAELRGPAATESAFRKAAPRYAIVHVATHGFQSLLRRTARASQGLLPQLRGTSDPLDAERSVPPGLLCGLALAGANAGVTAPADTHRVLDDGILTALEAADLDLGATRLVVLSACETGLGQSMTGEGVLGLQRAFQLAGARASIATLWPVDDDASKALMLAFYQRLREGGPRAGALDALREAQRDMIRGYDPVKRTLARGPAGKRPVVGAAPPPSSRLSPELWAGFVLSGDWR
jgi:CHAT domain-containing protein